MKNAILIAVGCAAAAVIAAFLITAGEAPDEALREQFSFVDRYCVDCHNDAEYTGDLSLEGLSADDVHADAEIWEAAVRKLRVGMMPPRDALQPEPEVRAAFVTALEGTLDAATESEPFAGRYAVHRLNRAEYQNAIRDLLGIEIDASELLPSDGGDFGFDNIASVLTTSPLLLERYLTVSLRVSALAAGDDEAAPSAANYKIGVDVTQDQYMAGMPLGTRGGTRVTHNFPADAEYVLSGRLLRTVAEGYVGVEGHESPHEFIVTVDGARVFSASIGGPDDHELSSQDILASRVAIDERMTSPPISITAGPHEVAFTWVERPFQRQDIWQPPLRDTQEAHNPSGLPRLETGVIAGPYNVSGVSDTPSRERIFICQPDSEAAAPACAETILTTLAKRAFRGPVEAEDIAAPLEFYNEARANGGDFEDGIRSGLARILVSPAFLFRAEADPADLPGGGVHRITDLELASRLSFFLWSSIPDEELLGLAEAGQLREPDVLEGQVRRMVSDARANALVENFMGQWLELRNLEQRVVPDLLLFPDFDDNLRKAFRTETEMLFSHVLREGRSVLELLSADYTFVNERLARHYGLDGVYGPRFRKVAHEDANRHGLLGHGSLLSLTSAASRTSPIIRGKYVLANLLNNPPTPPPPVVPALEDSAPKDRPSTVREQLELHRADAACSQCHDNIDPIGFALENFDAVGVWRDQTREGLDIDSAGVLVDGTPVDGPVALRNALLSRPEVFAGTVAEKLMIYALGRGLEAHDMPQVRRIVRNAAQNDYQLMSIVLGIVDSLPFQMRTKLDEADAMESIAQTRE